MLQVRPWPHVKECEAAIHVQRFWSTEGEVKISTGCRYRDRPDLGRLSFGVFSSGPSRCERDLNACMGEFLNSCPYFQAGLVEYDSENVCFADSLWLAVAGPSGLALLSRRSTVAQYSVIYSVNPFSGYSPCSSRIVAEKQAV